MRVKKLSTIHLRDPEHPYQAGYNESINSVWDDPKTANMDNFPLGPNPPDEHGKLFTPELSSKTAASGPSLTPAIRFEGKLYRAGPKEDHMDALLKIKDSKERQRATLDGDTRVFITNNGRVLSRERAMEFAVENDLLNGGADEEAPELIAEWLQSVRSGAWAMKRRMSRVADILPVLSPHNHPAKPDHGAFPHRAEEEGEDDHEAGMTLHTPPSMRPSRKENLITLGDPDISSDPDISGDTDVKHDPDMIMSFLSTNHRALSSPDMQGKMREYRDLRQEVQKVENKVRSQGGDKDSPWSLEVKKSDKYKRLLGKLSELEAELQGYGMQRYQLQKLATTVEPNEENETPEHLLQRKTMNFK